MQFILAHDLMPVSELKNVALNVLCRRHTKAMYVFGHGSRIKIHFLHVAITLSRLSHANGLLIGPSAKVQPSSDDPYLLEDSVTAPDGISP